MKKITLISFLVSLLFISCFETTADTIICNNSDTLRLAYIYGDSLYNAGCDIQINDVVIFSDDQEIFVEIIPADTSFNYWLWREIPDHCPQEPCTFSNNMTQLTQDGEYRAYEYMNQKYLTYFSAIKADSSDMMIKLTPAPGSSPVYKAFIQDDFKSYNWSNGSTAFFTLIDEPGLYTVNAVTYFGDTLVNSILIKDEAFAANQFYTGQKTGDHVHYTDLVPDTTAHYYHGGIDPPFDDFTFDVNQDGISELKFNVSFGSGLGAWGSFFTVTPLNGCEILNTGDAKIVLNIEEKCALNQYFEFSSMENMLMHRCGYSMSFLGCSAGRWQDADHYLGFRFPIAGDTAYGWMHISFSTEWAELNLVIDDFAYYSLESGNHVVNELSFSVYPNPFANQIRIQPLLPHSSIEIFDIIGHSVYQMVHVQENSEIDLSNLSRGIYFLKLESGDKRFTQKLIKR